MNDITYQNYNNSQLFLEKQNLKDCTITMRILKLYKQNKIGSLYILVNKGILSVARMTRSLQFQGEVPGSREYQHYCTVLYRRTDLPIQIP